MREETRINTGPRWQGTHFTSKTLCTFRLALMFIQIELFQGKHQNVMQIFGTKKGSALSVAQSSNPNI